MLVFNNQQRSGYDELVSYSPDFYKNIREMDAIYRFAGWTLDLMAADLEKIVQLQFVLYLDQDVSVLERVERFLGIVPSNNKTLYERKMYIYTMWNSRGKLSATSIRNVIQNLLGANTIVDIYFDTELYINVESLVASESINEEIESFLTEMLPAHIKFNIVYQNTLDGHIYGGSAVACSDIITLY